MEGAACNPSEYRIKLKEISAAWKALDAAGKEPYNIQAAHQQELRNRLAEEPLAAQTAQAGTAEIRALESQVDRNARKKLAARRLQLNVQAEAQHSWWTAPTQYADSAFEFDKNTVLFPIVSTQGFPIAFCYPFHLFPWWVGLFPVDGVEP